MYSSDDNSLPFIGVDFISECDSNLGDYRNFQLSFSRVRSGISPIIVGHMCDWYAIFGISFHLDTGNQTMTNIVPPDLDHVHTIFPSLHIEEVDQNDQRGYFRFDDNIDFSNAF